MDGCRYLRGVWVRRQNVGLDPKPGSSTDGSKRRAKVANAGSTAAERRPPGRHPSHSDNDDDDARSGDGSNSLGSDSASDAGSEYSRVERSVPRRGRAQPRAAKSSPAQGVREQNATTAKSPRLPS